MNILRKRIVGFALSALPTTIGSFLAAQDFGSPARFAQYIRQPLGSYESYRPFGVEAFDTGVPGFVGKASFLKLDAAFLNDVMSREPLALHLEIPVSAQKTLKVRLSYASVVTDKFEVLTASGKKASLKFLTYQGTVEGTAKSLVSLTIFKDELMGIVSDGTGGNYVLGLKNQQQKYGQYIIYNDKDLLIKNNFQCGTPDAVPKDINNPPPPPLQLMNASCKIVAVYFECDHKLYQNKGSSIEETVKYTVALFNEVAYIYENEQINVKISAIKVWDMPDPYPQDSSEAAALNSFAATLQDNFPGNIAHLLSLNHPGSGLAWVGVLCDTYRFAYSGIFLDDDKQFPIYSSSVEVITHEIGHNLGSNHTHWCGWEINPGQFGAIDGCAAPEGNCPPGPIPPMKGGTIMSYCHLMKNVEINFELGFGPLPGKAIRDHVAGAQCLSADLTDQACNGGNCTFTLNCVGNPAFALNCNSDVNYNMAVIQDPDLEIFSEKTEPQEAKNSIDPVKIPFLTLSPNPFSSELRLRIRMEKEERVSVLLRDLNGAVRLKAAEYVLQAAGLHNLVLNTSALPPGVYLLEVSSESRKEIKRVVKQ